MASIFFHPVITFLAGIVIAIVAISLILSAKSPDNQSELAVKKYNTALTKAGTHELPNSDKAVKRFTDYLQGIASQEFIRENTSKVYSENAYLNDTIVTHEGAKEIEDYFLKTAETMTGFEVIIDDTFSSGPDHYVRWTMIFSAPALGKSKPVHSIGISQIRFTPDGKVAFHQDFWDSGANIFGQIPISGGLIEIIRKRME